jgi:serine/threonine-protein kinase HipA
VLNGLRAHGRYQGSYENVAKRIEQFVSVEHQRAALEQFFTTLSLCCAIENGDAHLKNFAVMYENAESTVTLAPAYDLIATTPYQRRDVLALSLRGSKAFPDRARLTDFGQRSCGLTPSTVKLLLERVTTGVAGALAEMRAYARAHPDFAPGAKVFADAFERGLARSVRG